MAKLRGKAKKAFLARMARGRKKAGHHAGRRKKSHKRTARKGTHHKSRRTKKYGSMAHTLSAGSPQTARAVKQVMDKAAHEMKKLKTELQKCEVAVKKTRGHVKRSGPRRKKHHKKAGKHAAKHHRAKRHHKGHSGVSAGAIIRGAKVKSWTCTGPRRTGCGGGARGGHVMKRIR